MRRNVASGSREPSFLSRGAGTAPIPSRRGLDARTGSIYAAATSNSSSRCLCDGQYLLPGSGTR